MCPHRWRAEETEEAEQYLDAFGPGAEVVDAIIEAIATGHRTWSGLTNRIGRAGGSLLLPHAGAGVPDLAAFRPPSYVAKGYAATVARPPLQPIWPHDPRRHESA